MKIKLLFDIPVDPKHGLIKDRVLYTIPCPKEYENLKLKNGVWVMTDEPVRILPHEYVIILSNLEISEL